MKRGTEMRALKIKETEAAYRLQLDAIKVDFDAGDLVKKAKVEAARQKIHDLEENHRKALERVDQWESKTTMDTNKDDAVGHIGVDAAGEIVEGEDLREQALVTLKKVEQDNPGESPKDIVATAVTNLFQMNLEAIIAKVRGEERKHFVAEWDHRMSIMAMDQEPFQDMDEMGPKPKRKPEDQAGPEEWEEALETVVPVTPPGPPPEATAEAVAAATAAAAVAAREAESEVGLRPVPKAKAAARAGPY